MGSIWSWIIASLPALFVGVIVGGNRFLWMVAPDPKCFYSVLQRPTLGRLVTVLEHWHGLLDRFSNPPLDCLR